MASRRLADLDEILQPIAQAHLNACKAQGIELLVTCTWRSNEEQARLYAQGRTASGPIVTNARPGDSKHNAMKNGKPASKAYDVVPMRDGKPIWDDKDPVWQEVGRLGESVGLAWAGRWLRLREFPHFELK